MCSLHTSSRGIRGRVKESLRSYEQGGMVQIIRCVVPVVLWELLSIVSLLYRPFIVEPFSVFDDFSAASNFDWESCLSLFSGLLMSIGRKSREIKRKMVEASGKTWA